MNRFALLLLFTFLCSGIQAQLDDIDIPLPEEEVNDEFSEENLQKRIRYSLDTLEESWLQSIMSPSLMTRRIREFSEQQSAAVHELHKSELVYGDLSEVTTYLDSLIAVIVPKELQERYDFRAFLLEDASMNALVLGVNHVYVNPGLIAECDNEDQIAMIIAHEIAHELNLDPYKGYERAMKRRNRAFLAAMMGMPYLAWADDAFGLKYSRKQESGADAHGAQMICEAGFSASEGAKIFQRFEFNRAQQSLVSSDRRYKYNMWSTHPAPEDRFEDIRSKCSNGGGSITQRFLDVRQICRKEVVEINIGAYDFRSAISHGWRYIGQQTDIELEQLTFAGLRRLELFENQHFDEPILSVMYELPSELTPIVTEPQSQWKSSHHEAMTQLMLGDDWNAYRDGLANPQLTFRAFSDVLRQRLYEAEDCPTCQIQYALSAKEEEQMKLFSTLDSSEFLPEGFVPFLESGTTPWKGQGKAWVVYHNMEIYYLDYTPGVYGSVIEYIPNTGHEVATEFPVIGDTAMFNGQFDHPYTIKGLEEEEMPMEQQVALWRLRRIADQMERFETESLELFELEPELYSFFEEHELEHVEFIKLRGIYTKTRKALPSILTYNFSHPYLRAQVLSLKLDNGTLRITRNEKSIKNVASDETLRELYQMVYPK